MKILQTTTFKKHIKKLHKNQKLDLDNAIKTIAENPYVGEMKKGDLNGVRVYKFKMVKQLTLLAYEYQAEQLQLIMLSLGTHENFYRDLKK
jgi:mRNA-degrading endonuclease YafQ of YafQ-DinJ toxin-antitoxin module